MRQLLLQYIMRELTADVKVLRRTALTRMSRELRYGMKAKTSFGYLPFCLAMGMLVVQTTQKSVQMQEGNREVLVVTLTCTASLWCTVRSMRASKPEAPDGWNSKHRESNESKGCRSTASAVVLYTDAPTAPRRSDKQAVRA